jgi:hypothetical protein
MTESDGKSLSASPGGTGEPLTPLLTPLLTPSDINPVIVTKPNTTDVQTDYELFFQALKANETTPNDASKKNVEATYEKFLQSLNELITNYSPDGVNQINFEEEYKKSKAPGTIGGNKSKRIITRSIHGRNKRRRQSRRHSGSLQHL